MGLWLYLKRKLHATLFTLSGRNLALLTLVYIALSWLLLRAAGESDLTDNFSNFIYYLMVTASTVGYGDYSPTSDMGKWVVVLFVIPGGLALFASILGRLASNVVEYWRAGVLGKRKVNTDNHILLLGWNGQRTLHLIRMLQHEEEGNRPIVLCTRSDIENPLPGEIGFVKVSSYTDAQEMQNARIEAASCIIVDNLEDDITLSAALYCANINAQAHLVAYFKDEALSALLSQHCPNAECIPAVGAEMIAKAAVDPGSSALHQELLASTRGMTQYSTYYPAAALEVSVEKVFLFMKKHHQATLIAVEGEGSIELNPDLDAVIKPGNKLFYIADERIEQFEWRKIS
ncbi:two pore domain potassium channel family protein [Vibrio ponticus]|uniref:Two pore domain potassium channel family protein n=1 Tax=Vibrio ponticus TaxID=265668 RepID=A0A3N3E763_9VIBR|nr:potassium channel family protein [Vibrio ponticus]ROV62510.1 two pore domain potassium channel family protein [Vibrio ponticus]ROV62557.1 two pore domain potassium channel family protein [Vibrio ponticus]